MSERADATPFRVPPPHEGRCRAFTNRTGERCPCPVHADALCKQHHRWGSVQPDDWTQPDNLPVIHLSTARSTPVETAPS